MFIKTFLIIYLDIRLLLFQLNRKNRCFNRINHEIPVINIPVGFIENYQTDTEKILFPES